LPIYSKCDIFFRNITEGTLLELAVLLVMDKYFVMDMQLGQGLLLFSSRIAIVWDTPLVILLDTKLERMLLELAVKMGIA